MIDTTTTIIAVAMLIRRATRYDNDADDFDDDNEMLICFYLFWVRDTVPPCESILVTSALADDALLGRKCSKPVTLVPVLCYHGMSNLVQHRSEGNDGDACHRRGRP